MNHLQEEIGLVVDDEGVGEVGLGKERKGVSVVGNIGAEVGIAADKDGIVVLFAELEHADEEGVSEMLVAHRIEGGRVEFEEGAGLLGCTDYGLKVEIACGAIAWMADDVDARIVDGAKEGIGVLSAGAIGVAEGMEASNDVLHAIEIGRILEVKMTFIVDDVEFGSHHETHIAPLTRNDVHVAEVERIASAWDGWSMLGDAEEAEPKTLCLTDHLVKGAHGMA